MIKRLYSKIIGEKYIKSSKKLKKKQNDEKSSLYDVNTYYTIMYKRVFIIIKYYYSFSYIKKKIIIQFRFLCEKTIAE